MTMTREIKGFIKRVTCLLIVLVLVVCMLPDFTPKVKAVAILPALPSIGSGLAALGEALGLGALGGLGFVGVMETITRGASGYSLFPDILVSETHIGLMSEIFKLLTPELAKKVLSVVESVVELAPSETVGIEMSCKEMDEVKKAVDRVIPMVPTTNGLYQGDGLSVWDYYRNNGVQSNNWPVNKIAHVGNVADYEKYQLGYTIYFDYTITFYDISSGQIVNKVVQTIYMGDNNRIIANVEKGASDYTVAMSSRYVQICTTADGYDLAEISVNPTNGQLPSQILRLNNNAYFIPPVKGVEKASETIDFSSPDNADKTYNVTVPALPDFPVGASDEEKKQVVEQVVSNVQTTLYSDIIDESVPSEDEDDWVPVSNWDWLDKILKGILGEVSKLDDVYIDNLLAEIMGLTESMNESGVITDKQKGVLSPSLEKALEDLRAGGLTQEQIDAMTQDISNARAEAFPKQEINWGRLTSSWSGLANTFPFCIPFDLVNMISGFAKTEVRPPPIKVNIIPFLGGNAGVIEFNPAMEQFDGIRNLVRTGFLIIFAVGLALLTSKVIKW